MRFYFQILFIVTVANLFAQNINVGYNHRIYRFLEQLETRGLVELPSGTLTRNEIARALIAATAKYQANSALFSRVEGDLLQQFNNEFAENLHPLDPYLQINGNEKPLYPYNSTRTKPDVDLLFSSCIISQRGRQFTKNRLRSEMNLGLALAGNLGKKIVFFLAGQNSWSGGTEIGRQKFDQGKSSLAYVSGNKYYPDWLEAYLAIKLPWFRMEIGQQKLAWGPGYHGSMALSPNMPPASGIQLKATIGNFRFTSAHLSLVGQTKKKYMTGHRLEWRINPGMVIAGTETVIYSGRDPELAYLNPILPYHVIEHHLGDRDNNMISFDFKIRLLNHYKLYGEYFIDDMTTSESLLNYYGNKFAFIIGVHSISPFNLNNIETRLEYARIEPYVYTHRRPGNVYIHRDQIIGHWLGPNADDLFIELGYQFHQDLTMSCWYEHLRHGKGDVYTPHLREIQGDGKYFLKDTVEHVTIWGLKLEDQVRPDLFVTLQYFYLQSHNKTGIPGLDSAGHQAVLQLSLTY